MTKGISIFMRGDTLYWSFYYWTNGRRVRSKIRAVDPEKPWIKAESEPDAYTFAVIAKRRADAGLPPVAVITVQTIETKTAPQTLRQFVETAYRPWYEARRESRYEPDESKLLLELLGDVPLHEITQFVVTGFLLEIKARFESGRWSGRTANKRVIRAHAIFTQAIKSGLFDKANPFPGTGPFPVQTVQKLALSLDEEAALMAAALHSHRSQHLRHWIACVIETGPRVAEFERLKKADVFLSYDPWLTQQFHGSVQPPAVVYTGLKNGGRTDSAAPRLRAVPISNYALPHFEALLLTEGDLLWPYGRPRGSWRAIRDVAAQTHSRLKDADLACLRHTFRTRVERTALAVSPTDAATMMGHSPEIAQKHYTVFGWGNACEAIETLRRESAKVVPIWSHGSEKQKRQA